MPFAGKTLPATALRGFDADETGKGQDDDIVPAPIERDGAGITKGPSVIEGECPQHATDG